MENENLKPIEKLTPFTKMIMTIGTLPSSFYASMSYYESMVWLYEYLKNEIIPTVNNNAEAVEELQTAFTTLQNWIEHYFDNLDLQQEVNTKLDEMAEDGTLTNLIKDYVDPIYQDYEDEMNTAFDGLSSTTANRLLAQDVDIANFKGTINQQVAQINNKVDSATSGSPKGVYATVSDLTSDNPDHDYIYVVSADGNWYYYNTSTSSWTSGGTYQAAEDSETLTELEERFTDFVNFKTGNILDDTTYTEGYLNGNIPIPTLTTMEYTDFIDVEETYYKLEGFDSSTANVILRYDANHDYLGSVTYNTINNNNGLLNYIGSSTKAIRINFLKSKVNNGEAKLSKCDSEGNVPTSDAIKYANSLKATIEYTNASYWKNKKANFIGDSITYGAYTPVGGSSPDARTDNPFCKIACDILGITTCRNYGISGTSISGTSSTMSSYAFVNRYNNMDNDADLIVVCGGTNDYGTNVELGTIADTTDVSFYGALNVLCNGLQSKYLGKKIVFVTPIHRQNEGANIAGYTLKQYSQAIYDVAKDVYGFAVIDGFEMGLSCKNTDMKSSYIVDGLHPNPIGHEVYGKSLAKQLNSI